MSRRREHPAEAAARAALREESERLGEMGAALSEIAAAAGRVEDATALAALQDKNLAAYERMIADSGALALEKAQTVAGQMAEALDGDPEDAMSGLQATMAEIKAARDAGSDAFLRALAERLGTRAPRSTGAARTTPNARPETGWETEPFMEPFE